MTKKISIEEIMEIFPTLTTEKKYDLERKIEIFDEYIANKRTCYQVIDAIQNIGLSTFFAQIRKYKEGGIIALIHKSTGCTKKGKISETDKQYFVSLYNGSLARENNDQTLDFSGYSFAYFHAHLFLMGYDKISYSTLSKYLKEEGFVSPLGHSKEAKAMRIAAKRNIEFAIGERVEIDATEIYVNILGDDTKMYLHVAYDRGLAAPVGMWLAEQETTVAYFELMARVNGLYGIPLLICTDKRGCFVSLRDQNKKKTYFAKCFENLKCKIMSSSNSNFKPGVEGFNNTLKKQLPNDLERLSIDTVEAINDYLITYVTNTIAYNTFKASKKKGYKEKKNVYQKKISTERLRNKFVTAKKTRKINKNVVTIKGQQYAILIGDNLRNYNSGTILFEITNFRGKVRYKIGNQTVKLIPAQKAKEFVAPVTKLKIRKMPKDNAIRVCKEMYVPIKNNGNHVIIPHDEKVQVIEKSDGFELKWKNRLYKLIKRSSYKNAEFLGDDKIPEITFKHTFRAFGKNFIAVDEDGNHIPVVNKGDVIVTTRNMMFQCIIKGKYYNVIKLEDYIKKSSLPTMKTTLYK